MTHQGVISELRAIAERSKAAIRWRPGSAPVAQPESSRLAYETLDDG